MSDPFEITASGVSDTEILEVKPRSGRITHGTDQQEALWSALINNLDTNIIVEARAGTGKSSSCREGLHRLQAARLERTLAYAVYNKANADEFKGDCPPGVNVGTVHSMGFAALRRAFGSQVEKNKSYLVMDDLPGGRDLARYLRKAVSMLVGLAKNQAVLPGKVSSDWLRSLILHYDVNTYHQDGKVIDWARKVIDRGAEWTNLVDFDDMLWLPFVHECQFEEVDDLFLDEVQDWNPVQHALIPLMAKTGRVVAVGDPFQAIYAWRGADPDSMGRLANQLGSGGPLRSLPLTLTFRCPKSHVRLANHYVPDLQAFPANPEGTITELPSGAPLDVAIGDMVLSRTNAAVIRAALSKIAERVPCLVRGRAVGEQLVQIVRGCGEFATTNKLLAKVLEWRSREMSRLLDMEGVDDLIEDVQDRSAGLAAILQSCATPADVEPAISALFADRPARDVVQFSTIHRAKGAEAERVWILQQEEKPAKLDYEHQQRRNLAYVSLTRSKRDLFLVAPPDTTMVSKTR